MHAANSPRDAETVSGMRQHGRVVTIDGLDTLLGAALALGAREVAGWSKHETQQLDAAATVGDDLVVQLRQAINRGEDPLGDAFCRIRTAEARRPLGQTYTPTQIVTSMIGWLSSLPTPARVVDPGIGSGRFLVAAGRVWSDAALIGTDIDPVAAIMARANLAALGFADRAQVYVRDYREFELPAVDGPTAFVGNPPYVRHHQIDRRWKKWLSDTAEARRLTASQLAGLHVYFFLATVQAGRPGDYGAFITSAEWLDVNYGRLVRQLVLDGLGGSAIHVLEPEAMPFADAATTAAITCFDLHTRPQHLRMRRVASVDELGTLREGQQIPRERLAETDRWSTLTTPARKLPTGYMELGELCRVRRGTATGANSVWVTERSKSTVPDRFLFSTVTRAKELFEAGEALTSTDNLKCVIDLPTDFDGLGPKDLRTVQQFIEAARAKKVDEGYLASARKVWHSVGLGKVAPILATYMARRPPTFVVNKAGAHHLNIAHGLHPRDPMQEDVLRRLAEFLRASASQKLGRTYAGGLTKFEPKEMERLTVPCLDILMSDEWDLAAAMEPLSA